jgi:anti-sigma factor RsiW
MSECDATRERLLDYINRRLGTESQARVEQHLKTCGECSRIFARERALDEALAQRPIHALPESLRARLVAQTTPRKRRPKLRWSQGLLVATSALLVAALVLFVGRSWYAPNPALVNEAVNDHLRVLYAEHPIEIESGGIHQVKPWFTGRLDFAPPITFSGDGEFPLVGGAVAVFVDRKAATFVFKHRLHTITLLVFRSEGLPFPLHSNPVIAGQSASHVSSRGFHLLLWREADLGYALVSDVDPTALTRLASKLAAR